VVVVVQCSKAEQGRQGKMVSSQQGAGSEQREGYGGHEQMNRQTAARPSRDRPHPARARMIARRIVKTDG
jgi:hypothetical protein